MLTKKNYEKTNIGALTENELILKKMMNNSFKFDLLTVKTKIDLYEENSDKKSFNAVYRIKKDSIIWISVNLALGIEIARLYITPDSFKYLDRLNNTIIDEKFEYLRKISLFPVTFHTLEAYLTGNPNIDKNDPSLKFSVYTDNNNEFIRLTSSAAGQKYTTLVDTSTYKIRKVGMIDEATQQSFDMYYNDHGPVSGALFPSTCLVNIVGKYTARLEFNITKVKIEESLNFPFKVPQKYGKNE